MTPSATLDPLSLPLHGTRLIEASAGTGKTWTITALYLRLVLGRHGSGQPLLPPQILVLTFTKAATAELRERIRGRLAEAVDAFRRNATDDGYLRRLIDAYPGDEARALAARQLELAAQWMDEAAVHTIHGWCQRMLGQHAFDGGHPLLQEVGADESDLLAEAVRDYWRLHFFPLDRSSSAQVVRCWSNPQALQKDVAPLLRQPLAQLRLDGRALPAIPDLAAALDAQLAPLSAAETRARSAWSAHAPALAALLHEALAAGSLNANSYKADKLQGDLAELQAWAEGGALPGRKTLERASQDKLASATKKGHGTPRHDAFELIGQLLAALDRAPALQPLILAHALPWIAARLEAARQSAARLGYDDMLRRLDAALHGVHGDTLAQAIASQYPVALIDEFQDTDPLQWRIFRRIYGGRDDTGLLLIGDPKQAIYGFRGADIHTYLAARREAVPPTWTLGTNYRSTTALVDAVNGVFEHAERQPLGAFAFGRGALPFQPVRAHGRRERLLLHGRPLPAMQLARSASLAPISKDGYRKQMAAHAAAWLVALLDAAQRGDCGFVDEHDRCTPLAPGDVAVLVRSGGEAAIMRQALQARGLASVYLSDRDSVYAAPEAADLLRWLHACAEPGSDRAMRAALATATLGLDYAELDRLNQDERYWENCGERFRQLHDSWLRHGVLAMLHELLHQFDLPARLLARAGGERVLTNLLHLAELLQQAATALDGEHALVRHLAGQIAQAGDPQAAPGDEQIVRLESEAALVKVVTVHKSKGLEYPLVLLPFVCAMRETRRGDRFVLHDDDGEASMDLQPTDEASARADRERLQEDLRLLYVALTRARHACWLGIANLKDGQKKDSGLHKSAFGYVLAGGAPIGEHALPGLLDELRQGRPDVHVETLDEAASTAMYRPAEERPPIRPARSYGGQPPEPWWIASYSALRVGTLEDGPMPPAPETAQEDVRVEAVDEPPQIPPSSRPDRAPDIHSFPRGAEPGTFLHDLLEWAAGEGFAESVRAPQALVAQIARRCQRRGWQAWAKPLAAWLPALLLTPLALPGGGRVALAALADPTACRAELEFWFEADHVDTLALDRLVTAHTLGARPRPPLLPQQLNGMLKGFIDLLFEHEGRYFIVDYKSNWLGSSADAYTEAAMDASVRHSRYELQYAIYTLALHRQLRARLPGYRYEDHMGGVFYLYLRGVDANGHGVHRERLPLALIDALDRLFAEGTRADAA